MRKHREMRELPTKSEKKILDFYLIKIKQVKCFKELKESLGELTRGYFKK